ncbi:hypothetical protein HELRODRAFT_162726 [Helobdella robusta]|uniref:Uncharacterized protein n=1 Tax=Helobdella robusta TaxID=6412 RepID=T1ET22_HELRO|nr:hypothetical protein HELRODRAFT_162726 [Helobdella robusta]ESN99214.1 hypothetical protein HELRODRAFT_162726 [Helobdella robusta]
MNAEKLQKSEPMEIPSCVRNYANEYKIQQKQKNETDSFSQNPRPVFIGPVSQSVGFRTTLACFHWAVESDRLSHDQHKTTRVRTTLETNCVTLVRVRNYANEHRVSYQIHF